MYEITTDLQKMIDEELSVRDWIERFYPDARPVPRENKILVATEELKDGIKKFLDSIHSEYTVKS